MSLSYELHKLKHGQYKWCAGCEREPLGMVSFASDKGYWFSWTHKDKIQMFNSIREAVYSVNNRLNLYSDPGNPLSTDEHGFNVLSEGGSDV